MRRIPSPLRSNLDTLILWLLRKSQPLSSYTIHKHLVKEFDLILASGVIWSHFNKMEELKIIERKGKGRFFLTQKGEALLETHLGELCVILKRMCNSKPK